MTNPFTDNQQIEEETAFWTDDAVNAFLDEKYDMYDEWYQDDDAALEEYSLASTYGYEY
ncbi:MAG: hypothetical protein ACO3CD_04305 [Candidatus Nanopelagicaceae bacterium]